MKQILTKKELYQLTTIKLTNTKTWNSRYSNFLKNIKESYILLDNDYLFYNIRKCLNFIKQLILNNNKMYYIVSNKYYYHLRNIYKLPDIFIFTNWINGFLTNYINNKYNKVRTNNNLLIIQKNKQFLKKEATEQEYHTITTLPDCILVFKLSENIAAINESIKLAIPVISFFKQVDNYKQLNNIDYLLPINDQHYSFSIKFYINIINKTITNTYYTKYREIFKKYNKISK